MCQVIKSDQNEYKIAGRQRPLEGDPIFCVGVDQLQNNIH